MPQPHETSIRKVHRDFSEGNCSSSHLAKYMCAVLGEMPVLPDGTCRPPFGKVRERLAPPPFLMQNCWDFLDPVLLEKG
jgi:hypothetical protein